MYWPTVPALSKADVNEYDFDQLCPDSENDVFDQSIAAPRNLPDAGLAPAQFRAQHSAHNATRPQNWALDSGVSGQSPALAVSALRKIHGVIAASRIEIPAVPTVCSGLTAIDTLTGGLPRGSLTEICGPASSGRTSLMLSTLAAATKRGELCALVDAGDSFDPHSAEAAGINLDCLLWIRCSDGPPFENSGYRHEHSFAACTDLSAALHARQQIGSFMPHAKVWYGRPPARSEREQVNQQRRDPRRTFARTGQPSNPTPEHVLCNAPHARKYWAHRVDQALKATDLLLQAGGFGIVIIDLGDVPSVIAQRIPLTSWFRFRRAVENTPAVLLTIAQQSCARACASLVLQLRAGHDISTSETSTTESPSHAHIFQGLNVTVEVLRSRVELTADRKKPPRPVRAAFDSRTQWAG